MKYVKYKVFSIGAYEKEEQWLNEMSAKGMHLTDIGFCRYVFEKGTPGEYIYRLQMLENIPTHPQSVDYIRFVEDTGAEQVGSILRWVYFRKKAANGPFDLYSDLDSRLKHYRSINAICNVIIPIEFIIGALNIFIINVNVPGELPNIIYRTNMLLGLFCIGLGIWVIFISRSIRKKIKILKKESTIRE
ncbi:DUF2812 domain-containing protein [Paenibacillus wynnii]|uniref:DUF2812 domain-containing protein n=1 Tax=Paenibacillus wynnii TaxID=268407 RepID=A0A098M309_9BACL|nr:DUF2812 domain-containing protein [Paenibacillus wynnii]KGE16363.1 hypothetical protein PWYN_16590 [Paenibacillus wynnii]